MELNIGSVYPGKVTEITKFGVFVELEKGTTGLVHISEVSTNFVNDINDFVKLNEQNNARFNSAMARKRRMKSKNEIQG